MCLEEGIHLQILSISVKCNVTRWKINYFVHDFVVVVVVTKEVLIVFILVIFSIINSEWCTFHQSGSIDSLEHGDRR